MKTGFRILVVLALASAIYLAGRGWFVKKEPVNLAPQKPVPSVDPVSPQPTAVLAPSTHDEKIKSTSKDTRIFQKETVVKEPNVTPIDPSLLMPVEDDTCSPKKKEPCGDETPSLKQEKDKLPF